MTEVLIAIALFSTAFLYLLGTITTANHAIKQSSDNLVAQDLAERVMEQYKGRAYASTLSTASNGTWDVNYDNNGAPVTLAFQYQVDVVEANMAAPFSLRRLKDIKVTVVWNTRYMERLTDTGYKVRSVVLETAVGQL